MRVLVTGGTGVIGSFLVPALRARGHEVLILTRREGVYGGIAGDISTGAGIEEAMAGVQLVIHLASTQDRKQWQDLDVGGTARLAAAARRAGVRHFVYVSIIGVDRIAYSYYRAKLEAEAQVRQSGVPFTIVRISQFHELVDAALAALPRLGLRRLARLPLPTRLLVQPIAAADAASVLAERTEYGPSGKIETLAGPEVRTSGELAESWLSETGRPAKIVDAPLGGAVRHGFERGLGISRDHAWPGQTFAEFVRERVAEGRPPAYDLRSSRPEAKAAKKTARAEARAARQQEKTARRQSGAGKTTTADGATPPGTTTQAASTRRSPFRKSQLRNSPFGKSPLTKSPFKKSR